MNLERMKRLWPVARVIHEARRDLAWGKNSAREPWPADDDRTLRAYPHDPIAYVDLALASAAALEDAGMLGAWK